MTLSELTAEIENDLQVYADSGDIDKVTIKTNTIDRLKKLGLNICVLEEDVFKVENSRAILPQEFNSVKLALNLDPIGCHIHGDRHNITQDYIYRERIENPAYFDDITQEYITSCNPKIITEKITINETPVDFFYKYRWLSVVKGVNKNNFAVDCLNLHPSIRNAYPNQINVTGNVINTNFNKGRIYVQYYAFPTENGEIVIPEFTTGDIVEYIKQYNKVKIAEFLIANNKNPQGLTQLYPVWLQELVLLKRAALVEAKFHSLPNDWYKKFKRKNQRDINRFTLPNLKF